jgi:hypothetical protein
MSSQRVGSDCDEFNKSSQFSGLEYPSVHRDENQEYVANTLLFVTFSENVAEVPSQNK